MLSCNGFGRQPLGVVEQLLSQPAGYAHAAELYLVCPQEASPPHLAVATPGSVLKLPPHLAFMMAWVPHSLSSSLAVASLSPFLPISLMSWFFIAWLTSLLTSHTVWAHVSPMTALSLLLTSMS